MSSNGFNIPTTYNQGYQEGFNQGLQEAAQKHDLFLEILIVSFAMRMFIQLPQVQQRIESIAKRNLHPALLTGVDVLAFFTTVLLYWASLGNPIIK